MTPQASTPIRRTQIGTTASCSATIHAVPAKFAATLRLSEAKSVERRRDPRSVSRREFRGELAHGVADVVHLRFVEIEARRQVHAAGAERIGHRRAAACGFRI